MPLGQQAASGTAVQANQSTGHPLVCNEWPLKDYLTPRALELVRETGCDADMRPHVLFSDDLGGAPSLIMDLIKPPAIEACMGSMGSQALEITLSLSCGVAVAPLHLTRVLSWWALPFLPGPVLALLLRNPEPYSSLGPWQWSLPPPREDFQVYLAWPCSPFCSPSLPPHANNLMTNYPIAKLNWLLHQIPWIIGRGKYIAH